jgi:hypothetical protein
LPRRDALANGDVTNVVQRLELSERYEARYVRIDRIADEHACVLQRHETENWRQQ